MRKTELKSRSLAKQLRRNMTSAEGILWARVRRHAILGRLIRRQHPIGPYVADFACVSGALIVEVDGATHSTGKELAHDLRRDAYLAAEGWRIMRITNEDVYRNLDAVLQAIADRIPSPSSAAGAASDTSPVNGGGNDALKP